MLSTAETASEAKTVFQVCHMSYLSFFGMGILVFTKLSCGNEVKNSHKRKFLKFRLLRDNFFYLFVFV